MANKIQLYNGDCLEIMKTIPDNSVDLIVTDPPYNIKKAKWDTWPTVEDYVKFMNEVFLECQRVLKHTGSFYFFHNDFLQMVELQNVINRNTNFHFKSFITWTKFNRMGIGWKNPGDNSKLKRWFSICEYILYYTLQAGTGIDDIMLNVNNFKSLRNYSREIHKFIGVSLKEINKTLGHRKAEHFFYYGSKQWTLLNEKTYNELISAFRINNFHGFKEYKDLKKEFEKLKKEYESLSYIHNLDKDHCNVFTSNEVNTGKDHPTQKPIDILKRLILTSSHENYTVFDPFMGSGSTGVACLQSNRNFIGIEKDYTYFKVANERINNI